MKARITVTLKSGVLDPQGKAIEHALASLGVPGVESLRQGKVFDVEIAAADKDVARKSHERVRKAARQHGDRNYAIEI